MTKKQHSKFFQRFTDKIKRRIAGTLAGYMFLVSLMTFVPSQSYALTGGPSQPEVQSFAPIGTNDMVNPFSGDFTYNIPLLDVEGYPINLAYNSGITMDQEASWTGLGWNINVGTINRGLRGIPDDFNGDKIITETNIRPNRTTTIGGGISGELLGSEILGFSADLGISFNNYNGVGLSLGGGLDLKMFKGSLTAGLGLSSSSDNGLSISPSLSYSAVLKEKEKSGEQLGMQVGVSSSYSNRGGLKSLSINSSMSKSYADRGKRDKINSRNSGGVSSSFNMGQQTYIPSGGIDMNSFAISGRFKLGIEFLSFDPGTSVDASYASQRVKNSSKHKESPAYGYFNTEKGQGNDNALLDFNREKDGTVSNSTPALPLTNYTHDIFSVSGQGVGGSYRPYRSEIGFVHDPKSSSTSTSTSIGAEVSGGNLIHWGANVGAVVNTSKSGKWQNGNGAYSNLTYSNNKPYADFEHYYLREANEMSVDNDPSYFSSIGGFDPVNFKLQKSILFNTQLESKLQKISNTSIVYNDNTRDKRERRNNIITTLTIGQVNNKMGLDTLPVSSYASNNANIAHHIGQITSLGTDGMRYVYGLPAYNTKQQEVTFSVGRKQGGASYPNYPDCNSGLIEYNSGDNSINNEWGVDHYFQKKETPAYAHSYMLTAVVSPDYVDLDGNGPSTKDLGSYTKFNYKKIEDYNWRTPTGLNQASYNPGLNTNPEDDKANYIYGEKELWYLDKIETKNFIAVFETEDREDGRGVNGENGGLSSKAMQVLKTITLYAKPDYDADSVNATPLKKVHFEYDYSLCQGITNSSNGGGKLTLKKVYFTYRDSKKGKLSPYEFTYGNGSNNYSYNMRGYDRWGNYMPNTATSCDINSPLSSAEYPYVSQLKDSVDMYASAWSLTNISLPSGGNIKVELESDDYAFVQNREAMQMFKIISIGDNNNNYISTAGGTLPVVTDSSNTNRRIFFELDPSNTDDINAYIKDIDLMYFKCLMKFTNTSYGYDYVSGYAEIEDAGIVNPGSGPVGYLDLKPVSLKDPNDAKTHSPIAVTAAQFGRMHLSTQVWDSPVFDDNSTFGIQLLNTIVQTFYTNFKDGFKNPNKAILDKERATDLVINKSFIRLNNVNKYKLGGGVRVASIKMNDSWDEMTGIANTDFDYGQEYDYTETYVENGIQKTRSSGVASYEPQIGGDENPFKQAYFFNKENLMAPDDRFYQEEPFGESFFPSASVGYSKVTVRNLRRGVDNNSDGKIQDNERNVIRHATGKIEHEFYTAKEFPTITRMTKMDHKRDKMSPFSILSIFNFDTKDYFTASQGFVVELNDMHGKPKSQKVFQEDNNEPITEVEYFYQNEAYAVTKNGIKAANPIMDANTKRLANEVTVMYQNGVIDIENIGVTFDAVADFRQSKNTTLMPSVNLNLDAFIFGVVPIGIPTVLPSYRQQRTRFRSAGFTKVINRFGVLSKTVAKDLGSVVETKNLAYDAEIGNVLVTETTTNFEDKIYTMNYPAYWHYDNMGAAYKNIGFRTQANIISGTFTTNANYFTEGDEVILTSFFGSIAQKGWITETSGASATVQLFDGSSPIDGIHTIEVIRSGRRNMQMQNMASITTLSNPLNSFSNNLYENVLQASAIEFSDSWRTYCDCFVDEEGKNISYNPYVIGKKGNYRPIVSYLPLSDRVQNNYNNSINIRKDGVFEKYRPYYVLRNGNWEVDKQDWTFTSSVTEFNPYGQEVENQDALGRYSAATFGFNQTLTKAVAANARVREIGFTSFEDDDFSECADNHFKFDTANLTRDVNNSHTGAYSIKVSPSNNATLTRTIAWCDPTECDIDVTQSLIEDNLNFSPTGGKPNYVLDWNLVSGEMPYFSVNPTTSSVTVSQNNDYTMTLSWLDSKGCSTSYKLIISSDSTTNNQIIKLN